MSAPPRESPDLRNYVLVTGAYWADTVTDGAIRVLVLFYFYELGYSAFEVASLFLFYEFFGIVTNLVGGFLAARFGLKATLVGGLATQCVALSMLAFAPAAWLVVPYVMAAQALSGIAKDLTKMSSKSAVKLVVPEGQTDALFRWVAILTGSKNALKGVGFFVGGVLLTVVGFQPALRLLLLLVGTALVVILVAMHGSLGRASKKAKFGQMFSNNHAVNVLAAARVFLFAARDVWFVVGLPVFLRSEQGWSFWQVGAFLAVWVIGYGAVQASAPRLLRPRRDRRADGPDGDVARAAAGAVPGGDRLGARGERRPECGGRARADRVRRRVRTQLGRALVPDPALRGRRSGGDECRLLLHGERRGTAHGHHPVGALYQWQGLEACLWASVVFVLGAAVLSRTLPAVVSRPRVATA